MSAPFVVFVATIAPLDGSKPLYFFVVLHLEAVFIGEHMTTMSSTMIFQGLIDTWLTSDRLTPEIFSDYLRELPDVRCCLHQIDVTPENAEDWIFMVRNPSWFASKYLYSKKHLEGMRLIDCGDEDFVRSSLIPQYTFALNRRQTVIDAVNERTNGFVTQYERLVLPQRTAGRPSWLVSCIYINFIAKQPQDEAQFDDIDENIVVLCGMGETARTIANELNLSRRTIEHRLERLKRRVGARTLSELVSIFSSTNLLRGI